MKACLESTYFLDFDHPDIEQFVSHHINPHQTDIEKAMALYYAVRDQVRYDPYTIDPEKTAMKASAVLKKGRGFCVAKAVLLAACTRSVGIPSRLGFADVKNHLNTEKLKSLMETDMFVYHGFTELFLNEAWVKATPAFNLELCSLFGVRPLEFDGTQDSIFHPFDKSGNKHMEYIREHGSFDDLPWDMLISQFKKAYPKYFETLEKHSGDFAQEAQTENQ